MKTVRETTTKAGKRQVTVELDAGETLIAVKEDAYYELGEPLHGDVLDGHILANVQRVSWCSIEQKWR